MLCRFECCLKITCIVLALELHLKDEEIPIKKFHERLEKMIPILNCTTTQLVIFPARNVVNDDGDKPLSLASQTH